MEVRKEEFQWEHDMEKEEEVREMEGKNEEIIFYDNI